MSEKAIPLVLARAWEQQLIWSLTANRLKDRLDRARAAALVLTLATAVLDTPGNPASSIDDGEQVISVENQGWMTRWTTEDVSGTAQ